MGSTDIMMTGLKETPLTILPCRMRAAQLSDGAASMGKIQGS